jgi:hypothetical protein
MILKGLFIKEDENDVKVEPVVKPKTSFPTTSTAKPATVFPNAAAPVASFPTSFPSQGFGSAPNQELINKFTEKYSTTFDGLNQPGYDFYEFYKAIVSANMVDNPQGYQMALSMATAMDASVTKDHLVSQADFYVGKLMELYNQHVTSGNAKKQDLLSQKDAENHSLSTDLGTLKQQLEFIQSQITQKESDLSTIDAKYTPLIAEVDAKLVANEVVKNDFIGKISKVKENLSKI